MKSNVFTVERMIRASPEVIFEVLADPAKHSLIDGSGMVQGVAKEGESARLALGVTFGMSMKMGISYATASTVVEFERTVASRGRPAPKASSSPTWPVGSGCTTQPRDDGTLVRVERDITGDHQRFLLRLGDLLEEDPT